MRNKDEERAQLLRQFDAGDYLRDLRGDRTLAEVGKDLGLSGTYLAMVERGNKLPSDNFISKLAAYYKVDEDNLFVRWGKIPILTAEFVLRNETLQRTLSQMSRKTDFTEEEKQELYDDIYATYQRHLKKKEGS